MGYIVDMAFFLQHIGVTNFTLQSTNLEITSEYEHQFTFYYSQENSRPRLEERLKVLTDTKRLIEGPTSFGNIKHFVD